LLGGPSLLPFPHVSGDKKKGEKGRKKEEKKENREGKRALLEGFTSPFRKIKEKKGKRRSELDPRRIHLHFFSCRNALHPDGEWEERKKGGEAAMLCSCSPTYDPLFFIGLPGRRRKKRGGGCEHGNLFLEGRGCSPTYPSSCQAEKEREGEKRKKKVAHFPFSRVYFLLSDLDWEGEKEGKKKKQKKGGGGGGGVRTIIPHISIEKMPKFLLIAARKGGKKKEEERGTFPRLLPLSLGKKDF